MKAVWRSDKGRVRERNEDSVAVLPEFGLVVLGDGMGGHHAGEVASQIVVESVSVSLMAAFPGLGGKVLEEAVADANRALFSAMDETPGLQGMGSTVVAGAFDGQWLHYTHVGDSRLYRFRHRILECLTRDHTLIQSLVDEGMFSSEQEARGAGVSASVLTQGLGTHHDIEIGVGQGEIEPGDLYLFCSDGLSAMVDDEQIGAALEESGGDVEQAAGRLLDAALAGGGVDNISLVVVDPTGGSGA
ncbi:MAG: protein phosphatase 2C domain-containing protein [Candidatus Sedimenticola endophacoides]